MNPEITHDEPSREDILLKSLPADTMYLGSAPQPVWVRTESISHLDAEELTVKLDVR